MMPLWVKSFVNKRPYPSGDSIEERIEQELEEERLKEGAVHKVAFIVSGVHALETLLVVKRLIMETILGGGNQDHFRQKMKEIRSQGAASPHFSDARLNVIFDTVLRNSYAAGREEQMANPVVKKRRPYRIYLHGNSKTPRPQHLAMHNTILPIDHSFWDTCAPPNGYFCSCSAPTITAEEAASMGLVPSSAPPTELEPDKGFARRPGTGDVAALKEALKERLQHYPAEIREAFAPFWGD